MASTVGGIKSHMTQFTGERAEAKDTPAWLGGSQPPQPQVCYREYPYVVGTENTYAGLVSSQILHTLKL